MSPYDATAGYHTAPMAHASSTRTRFPGSPPPVTGVHKPHSAHAYALAPRAPLSYMTIARAFPRGHVTR